MTLLQEDLEAVQKNPDHNHILKVLIKYQIHTLCQKLADAGEESFLVSASAEDGTFSHIGSIKGEKYIDKSSEVEWKFLSFCSRPDDVDDTLEASVDDTIDCGDGPYSAYSEENDNTSGQLIVTDDDSHHSIKTNATVLREYCTEDEGGLGQFNPDEWSYKWTETGSMENAQKDCPGGWSYDEQQISLENVSVKTEPDLCSAVGSLTHERTAVSSSLCETLCKEKGQEGFAIFSENLYRAVQSKSTPVSYYGREVKPLTLSGSQVHSNFRASGGISKSIFCTDTRKSTFMEKPQPGADDRHHCPVCRRIFKFPHQLIYHMRIHTGEKPFQCTLCGKRFSQSSNLTVHLRTHTGEKPYHCSVCNKAFAHSNNFKQHMKLHELQEYHY